MNVIFAENYDKMSYCAALILSAQILKNKKSNIGFATGQTPIGTYTYLIEMYKKGILDFSNITSFNLDEYYSLSKKDKQSYYYFMQKYLFKHININYNKIHIPDGTCKDIEKECKNYENIIKQSGGIDIQLLGIGSNGHIGFNEPNRYFDIHTHITDLSKSTINSNKRFFDYIDKVPKKAISIGIGSIMSSKEILLICSGKNKSKVVKKLINKENITPYLPASILHLHNNVSIIIDKSTIKI